MMEAGKTYKKSRLHSVFAELCHNKLLYLMFVPLAVYFIIFSYIPMAGIIVAFKDFRYDKGIFRSSWSGLSNFQYFFKSGQVWIVTRNTILYNAAFLIFYTVFSILMAILIAEIASKWYKKLSQTLMFLPYFISWVVVSAFVYNLFNSNYGLINTLITAFGGNPINIYNEPKDWIVLLPVLYLWKWIGYGSVFYLAALMGIDRECYESADIDGANIFQRIWFVTIPMLSPTIITLLLLGVSRILRGEFDMFYQLIGNNGLLFNSTDIIDTLVFRSVIGSSDFPMASAAGLYQSVLCLIIILTVNYLVRRKNPEYALF